MAKLSAVEREGVVKNLEALYASCTEALTGEWDKSDDGFEDMQEIILRVARVLGIDEDIDWKDVDEPEI